MNVIKLFFRASLYLRGVRPNLTNPHPKSAPVNVPQLFEQCHLVWWFGAT